MKSLLKKWYILLFISLLSANTRAAADTLEFANGQTMKTQQINPQETANNFQYGIIKVNYTSAAVTNLTLAEEGNKVLPDAFFVTEAHAATTPTDQNILTASKKAHEALRSALTFKDVQPYLSKNAYESLLTQKRNSNGRELMILQLLKTSIPDEIEIIQTQIKGDLSWAVARGTMGGQSFWGILAMTQEDGTWKLIEETWYGGQNKPVILGQARTANDFLNAMNNNEPEFEFITWVDKAGRPKSTLPLELGTIKTPKKSFCFFFFLNHDKLKKKPVDDNAPTARETPTPDIHIVGPSALRHDPKVYEKENDEDFDVSFATDKDGYYPNKMNLRMPRGKPREIYVGFLMSF